MTKARKKPDRAEPTPVDDALNVHGEPHSAPFPIVGVGASAGGLEAFTQLLKHLPLDTGMAFVLVQHLDPDHESALAQILSRATSLPVNEITNDQPVEPDHVYIIPRDTNLSIEHGVLKLGPRAKTRAPHRPIDSFFESLSQDQHDRAIGVVLSGTATDGTLGLEAIKAENGITFAQDDSAKHNSMPRSAVSAGCVDLVLSPAEIADELARIARHPYVAGQRLEYADARRGDVDRVEDPRVDDKRGEADHAQATAHQDDGTPLPSGGPPRGDQSSGGKSPARGARKPRPSAGREKPAAAGSDAEEGYRKILRALHRHSGVDFSLYKSSTIQRRINRRLILTKHDSLADYAGFLRDNGSELDALFSDVLISVTSFFRNPEMFDALQHTVLPELLNKGGDDPLRCWVLGCSTGQEAYSIAMTFVEAAEHAPRARKLQIFATDLNDALLDKARHGLYARTLAEDITPERLRRFFVQEDGGYRVNKMLREMVVFAKQNLIADPPFSRMDLISCRNLLIYLEPSLQKKALPTFHYALRQEGYLLLGASESIGGFTDLFEVVDQKHKIFRRKSALTPAMHLPVIRPRGDPMVADRSALAVRQPERVDLADSLRGELNAQREADRITVNQFAPPGVLVNAELQVLQFRGPTGAFLEPPSGKASFDVLKMARQGLMLPLRATINQAEKTDKPARKEKVRYKQDGKSAMVNLEVIPLKNLRDRCFLILFELVRKRGRAAAAELPATPLPAKKQEHGRVAELESEIAETREYLQSMQEQHEAATEELQAANEEVQSANEELQSVNEELETSKEELESANEELSTINDEMNSRNVELNRLNNDLVNFQSSTKLAVVLLGRDLTIRRFSPQAQTQFDLMGTDVGRPISHIRHGLEAASAIGGSVPASELVAVDLEAVVADVIFSLREQECEVRHRSGRWYSMRVRPYLTLDNKVEGAVLVLVDIDALKQSEQAAHAARDYAESAIASIRDPLLMLDSGMRIERANGAWYRTFGTTPDSTVGKSFYDVGNHQWNVPRLRDLLSAVLPRSETIEDFEIECDVDSIGRRVFLLNARRMVDPVGKRERVLLAMEDVTDRRHSEESSTRLAAIVTSSEDAIVSKDLNGIITSWNKGAERLFGYSPDEIIGKSVTLLIPEDHVDEEPRILERIRLGGVIEHYETVRQRKDGSRVDISLTVSPLYDAAGRIIGASKIARDITERRLAEAELQSSHARLLEHAEELRRFNYAATGRELRMIELKREINALCEQNGEAARYAVEPEGVNGNDTDGRGPPSHRGIELRRRD